MMYTRITAYWLPSFLYYLLHLPVFLIKGIWWNKVLQYKRDRIFTCIWYTNILRTQAYNYSEKNLDKREIFFIKYKPQKNYINVRCIWKKKCRSEEYENFVDMCGKRAGCQVSKIQFEKGWCCFKMYFPFIADRTYHVDKMSVSVGKSADGFKQWNWCQCPHALICGETGQGKTEFVKTLLIPLLNQGYSVYCVDGKNIDYKYISDYFAGYTAYDRADPEPMLKLIRKFEFFMRQRYEQMQAQKINSFIKGGYEPAFLLIDEQLLILKTLEKEVKKEFDNLLSSIILLGRAAGFFLISTMQRPDAKYISGDLRDNYGARIVVGAAKSESYRMMFGEGDYTPLELGQGWCNVGVETDIFAWAYREDIRSELNGKSETNEAK